MRLRAFKAALKKVSASRFPSRATGEATDAGLGRYPVRTRAPAGAMAENNYNSESTRIRSTLWLPLIMLLGVFPFSTITSSTSFCQLQSLGYTTARLLQC